MLRVLRLYLKLRFSSWSCGGALRVLRLYLKVAIFQPELQEHAPRTTFVPKSCDFQAGAEPATAGLRKQARKPRGNFQWPFREQQNRTAPQREHFDTHNLRRGFAETKKNSPGATARALRHARSSQRVARAPQNTQKTSSFCTSTTPIFAEARAPQKMQKNLEFLHLDQPKNAKIFELLHLDHADLRRGSRGHIKKRKKSSSFCTSTTPISAEGRAGISKNAKILEFLHLDHADLRRGSRGHRTKHKNTSSFCTSTTPISAEGRIPDRRQHPHPPP